MPQLSSWGAAVAASTVNQPKTHLTDSQKKHFAKQ
jgi:hypothetical protein